MINKKSLKEKRNKKKVNSIDVQNSKQLMTRSRSINQSLISGLKQTKTDSKILSKKQNNCAKNKGLSKTSNKGVNVKNVDKLKTKVKSLRKSSKKERKNSYNKCSKSSKIKKIKEIVKNIKTKSCEKVESLVKRELRNSYKNNIIKDNMKNIDNISAKNKSIKQSLDAIVVSNDKLNLKNVCQNSSKPNLCSKLFPTLNCMKSIESTNNRKKCKKTEKQENFDLKTKLRNNLKIETKNTKKEKMSEKSTKSNNKIESKTKSKNKIQNCFTKNVSKTKNTSKKLDKSVKNDKKVKKSIRNNNKSLKAKKSNSKDKQNVKKSKNELIVRRGHRLASLNASAKVRLLCENERERERNDDFSDETNAKQNIKKEKFDQKFETKNKKSKKTEGKGSKGENKCKALVAVDSSKKQLAVRKRKAFGEGIEIIDTRSSKRMASLNASAIMAASYSPERVRRSKSVDSNHSNSSVEMVREMKTISQTVSRFEINPTMNGINSVHMNHISQQNSVIQKHETIETVKQLKVSNKIKDRLLGIARLERQERQELNKQKRKARKGLNDGQNGISGAEVSGFQTKVQVTKVTQINTSKGVNRVNRVEHKDMKSGHQIDSILERDSSVVHKYQVQSTIEMQTTFNSANSSAIGNVMTITSPPQQTPTPGTGSRIPVHMSGPQTAQIMPTPVLTTQSAGQPTYFNFAGPTPVLQVHNQYPGMTSNPTLNPMPIINLSEPYPTHYSSAFSVPQFATHAHPTQNPFNYFHAGLYQPAGPLLQPFQDPCLIHKPIPFHPSTPQISHIHNSPQFTNTTLPTQSTQTFQNEMTQPFHPNTQYFQQFPAPIRPSQTFYFQAMPQTSGPIAQNATTFTLLNPSVHYSHPNVINSEQFSRNENPINNEINYLNRNTKTNSNNTNPSVTQTSNDQNCRHISKSIQCSPQSTEPFCDSTNSSVRMTTNTDNTPVVTVGPQINKKLNKSEKRKKSLLLKPNNTNRPAIDVIVIEDNDSQTVLAGHQSQGSKVKCLTNALTLSNLNKTNSQQRNVKTACVQVCTPLPSMPVPSMSSIPSNRLMPLKKQNKKRFSHGWQWEGKPSDKYVYLNNEEQSYLRKCYQSIRHNEGDVIRVRDCVLLRSGPRKTDLPFVAKISALWESPEGEMVMSLLWYYRPEHTDLEYYSNESSAEIFASKHRDINSVACIDDKCYVLTYNEFCRYKRLKLMKQSFPPLLTSLTSSIVPESDESYVRSERMPPTRVFPELVFCCRKVYDYRQKRILKNPI